MSRIPLFSGTPCSLYLLLFFSSHEEIEKTISSVLGSVESDRIRSFLKFLTAEPHIAGGPRDLELTDWIRDKWTEFGLDTVSLDTYNFLLSFPDSARPNKIHLLDAEGNVRKYIQTFCHEGAYNYSFRAWKMPLLNRTFLCMEATYPYATYV